jgi:Ca-activated chloride channel family protein
MNTQSFERQLRQIEPPAPDPEGRLRARRAALAEFDRLHGRNEQKRSSRWTIPKFWLGGFATACVAVVGISLFRLMPPEQRLIVTKTPVPMGPQADVVREVAPTEPAPPLPPAATVRGKSAARGTSNAAPVPAPAMLPEPSPPVSASAPAAATLTPVDGRRQVSASSQADVVDLNVIPPELQRMDVVTGGASATYGSGAMSGTANLALKTEQPAPPAPPAGGRAQQELSEVQVTGTRILTPNASAAPMTSITGEEMRRLGVVTAADALTQLVPQNISTYQPALVAGAAAPGDRQAFIGNTVASLQGLDPAFGSRTVTLIDGRRVVATEQAGDKFAQFEINPVKRTVDAPESTFSVDVDTASYSFVRRQLNDGVVPPANAVRTEEMINYFSYDWPAAESRDQPFKPTVTVSDSPWNKGRKLVHIGIKGYEVPAKQRPDVNLVLLLDVSGSMNSPDKLPLAQRSMAMLLDSLKPTDTVGIAVYAGAAGEVLPPTPVSEKDAILQALYSLRPGGSTAGAAGIQLAYQMATRNFRKGGVNRILLATDGDFNVGIRDTGQLKDFVQRQREGGVFLSVLGFGQGNYRDEMAQVLAQNGNGVAAYIDSLSEARKVLVQEASAQLFTIAKDVKLQVEFNPATVAEYRLVGYETRALNREDFNNDKVDAGDIGAGHTVTAIYEITPVGVPGTLVDERRYGADQKPATPRGSAGEYGYLKIRYKLPDGNESQLLTQPIAVKAGVPAAVRRDVQFATAVAGFAQLLQGGRYTASLSYDEVFHEAQDALGKDPNGYRAEFLQLVRKAQGMSRP